SQIEQKDHVIAELAPKAETLEGLKRSEGAMCGILLFFIHE
ncbi:MAG: phage antirepressor Ant, partial [Bartonella sp.]|nr:phage antirepressor Ant [Bartonella sp.]